MEVFLLERFVCFQFGLQSIACAAGNCCIAWLVMAVHASTHGVRQRLRFHPLPFWQRVCSYPVLLGVQFVALVAGSLTAGVVSDFELHSTVHDVLGIPGCLT